VIFRHDAANAVSGRVTAFLITTADSTAATINATAIAVKTALRQFCSTAS
jgi:hypothetical protein